MVWIGLVDAFDHPAEGLRPGFILGGVTVAHEGGPCCIFVYGVGEVAFRRGGVSRWVMEVCLRVNIGREKGLVWRKKGRLGGSLQDGVGVMDCAGKIGLTVELDSENIVTGHFFVSLRTMDAMKREGVKGHLYM